MVITSLPLPQKEAGRLNTLVKFQPEFTPIDGQFSAGNNSQGVCKPYGRLTVRVGDEDELGSFVFRTTGFNSIRTLSARLTYFFALSGGLLSCLPLDLRLRGKSTTQSHRAPIYYVDLTVRTGLTLAEALAEARAERQRRRDAGFDQAALDLAARVGFANGAFEELEEDAASVIDEFYPETGREEERSADAGQAENPRKPLADRLDARLGDARQRAALAKPAPPALPA